jgi:outer membrane lipoprotein-sorting protein
MKKTIMTLAIIALAFMAGQSVLADTDATEIMKKSHMAYYYAADDGISEVTMEIVKKGKTRTREFTMLRLDIDEGGAQKYYTYFKKPSDVSRLTFMVWKNPDDNDNRWLYVPAVDLVKQISADDKNSSFVGSDFSYEDVSGRHWSEDRHSLLSDSETIDGREAWLISSVPVKDESFGEKKSWIDKETYLPLREEYYDDDGELERVFTADKIEEIDGIQTITQRSMENVKKGQKTTVFFNKISYNVGVTDDIFTERYLKTPPRKFIR